MQILYGGFVLTVALDVAVDGVGLEEAKALVAQAHKVCPYSYATRGNINVSIETRLLQS